MVESARAYSQEDMMKKKTRKLVLSKETVGILENMTLDKVAGGITQADCGSGCSECGTCLCLDEPLGPP